MVTQLLTQLYDWAQFGLFYTWTPLLLLGCIACWIATVFTLPGNWGIVVLAAIFAGLGIDGPGGGITWVSVTVLIALAVAGEIIEGVAGAAGVAKLGGSRLGIGLSLVGAFVGSLVGVLIGVPVPVLGSAIAAVFGGAVGAFVGAAAGEHWNGKSLDEQLNIGTAAFLGRVLGTVGKLVVGGIMVVITAADGLVIQ